MRPTTAARYGRHAAHTDTLGTLAGLGCLASLFLIVGGFVWLMIRLIAMALFFVFIYVPFIIIRGLVDMFRDHERNPLR